MPTSKHSFLQNAKLNTFMRTIDTKILNYLKNSTKIITIIPSSGCLDPNNILLTLFNNL